MIVVVIFWRVTVMKKKNTMLVRLVSLAALAALIFCMAGCSEDGSGKKSSETKNNKNADGTYFDSGETFCRGVWAADDGENRVGYYIFYDGENGRFDDAHLGMSVPFAVRINGTAADFALGASDFTDPTTVENTGDGKRILTWTNENRVEYLTLLGEQEPDTFRYYTHNDLSEMALDYYEQQNGRRPESADVSIAPDGMASILLYGKKRNEIAGYSVDSITGKGTENGTENEVVFVMRSTDD